jgi:hypothetical protein
MFVMTRRYARMSSVEEAARRAEAGLAPILKQRPGFRGYYIVDGGQGVGLSISVFEDRQSALAVQDEAMQWIRNNLSDLYDSEPEITVGEVVVAVEAEQAGAASGAGKETGAEARPH